MGRSSPSSRPYASHWWRPQLSSPDRRLCGFQLIYSENMDDSNTILKLRRQLEDAEKEIKEAARHGLDLLEYQTELQNHCELQRTEMTTAVENLEQEKYSLQRELELKSRMLESLSSEYEHLKQQQKSNQENLKEQLERNHKHEIRILKEQWEKLNAELDEARLSEKQLKQKLDHQCELVANKCEELRLVSERAQETMSSEMIDLQNQIFDLENAKVALEEELIELQDQQELLERKNCNLTQQLERTQTEKDEREKEVVFYARALEKAREANQDIQIQLDQALHHAQDPSSKGNSLFSEVEDRRAEMERMLISMKVQHESLQKQHAFTRNQLHRMKVQFATLFQLKGSQPDAEQRERLQSMLAQRNSEVEKLLMKVRQLEKFQNQEAEDPSNNEAIGGGSGDETYYVDLLKLKLENSSKDIEKIKDELSLQRMKALAESQQVLELERKLFTNERQYKLCQSENMKLRIKLDELKMKYEPDEMTKLRTIKRKQEILPVDNISGSLLADGVSVLDTLSGNMEEKNVQPKDLGENIIGISFTEHASQGASGNLLSPKKDEVTEMPLKERKRVRIMDDQNESQALHESNGCENAKIPTSPRSLCCSGARNSKMAALTPVLATISKLRFCNNQKMAAPPCPTHFRWGGTEYSLQECASVLCNI
ncbi:protein Spindly isoform X1 [Ambystoma mexicanum]|uniref:protein Spindly isoform X1 n=2 Tax=Ambystoma mexicanum TaxID=8296 RepID=UPI0037E95550